ncbi:hypothetical protein CAL7716_021140 [Calothrix sp. PCC 7716]|nr:hypothetical protein CAL7716_021140 [Calothrix sp. PCC 7716]
MIHSGDKFDILLNKSTVEPQNVLIYKLTGLIFSDGFVKWHTVMHKLITVSSTKQSDLTQKKY